LISKKLCGVILDVDGTLIDSNDAHAHAFVEALAQFGYDVPYEEIRNLIGMGSDNLLPAAIDIDPDSPLRKKIADKRKTIFNNEYMPHIRPFPKVRELVERLEAEGLTVVVASSGEKEEVAHMLEMAEIDELVESTTSSADAENSKPDADIIQAALDKLHCTAEEVIMIGDTPYDIEAAGKAGVPVIAVRCGGFSDDDLADAIAIYDSPADLLAQYDESPLSRQRA
jgi:HAD superfamily hydrolase (TIGR01509 family)